MLVVVGLVAVAAGVPAGSPANEKGTISGPRLVEPGTTVSYTLRGFPPNARVSILLVPNINRGGHCCGIQPKLLGGHRTNAPKSWARSAAVSSAAAGRPSIAPSFPH
jgi:hypothetical protein